MKVRIKDYEAETQAYDEQFGRMASCMSRPFPNNVPDFIPFICINCYKTVEMSEEEWEECQKRGDYER